jgi:DNA mismatch endonuclease (patch repair protein)
MTDIFAPEKRSEIMSRIRGVGTKPELELRTLFDRLGVEYMYQARVGRWRVDFLLPNFNLIVEYRSCFWHPHEGCRLSKFPKSNESYWVPKLQRNAERDARKDAELARLGYKVFVIRDCDRKIKVKELEDLLGVGSDGR